MPGWRPTPDKRNRCRLKKPQSPGPCGAANQSALPVCWPVRPLAEYPRPASYFHCNREKPILQAHSILRHLRAHVSPMQTSIEEHQTISELQLWSPELFRRESLPELGIVQFRVVE